MRIFYSQSFGWKTIEDVTDLSPVLTFHRLNITSVNNQTDQSTMKEYVVYQSDEFCLISPDV